MCDGPESEFARKDLRRTECGREKVYHDAAVKDDSLAVSCSQVGNIYLKITKSRISYRIGSRMDCHFLKVSSHIETPVFQYFE